MSHDLSGHLTRGYELKERIGVGGFGAVYRAYQSAVGREVAVKVILPEFANHPDFIRRFETEAQLVARLEHPFIVPLFDYWRDPAGAYLVMRFFRGGSLRDRLDEMGSYAPEDAVGLMDQIASALSVAHRGNVVHRDLKPDNILLDDDLNAFLTDFGIATITHKGEDEEDEGITGSPGYMSPEQIVNKPVSPQSDIYSLGVMLYEILVGKHPYASSSTTELIFKHLQEPLPDLSLADTELPFLVNEVIQRATAKDPSDRFPDVMAFAAAFRDAIHDGASPKATPIEIDLTAVTNPYKGLRAFEEADAADFFGREALVHQLLGRLTEAHRYNRFLAVVGPSGSGKSSVVKAGMLPALRWGDVPGSEQWFIAEMVPGITPLENLESALLSVAVRPVQDLLEQLRRDERGLLNIMEQIVPKGSQLLLVIDQFEEVFTLLDSEQTRTHFLNLMRTAVDDPASPVRIIVTLRADFYDRPLLYEGFGSLMRERTEVVLPLAPDELERSIVGPAERAGLVVDPTLLAAIVSDVSEEPGALPLLQYVMTEVFERREGRTLTLDAYQASGGALGALARRAEELYTDLEAKYQHITRQIFLRLVTLGEGAEDTRRRVHWAELISFGIDRDSLQYVLDVFGRYRLLSFDRDMQTREPTVEVAHEALIREWTRLREWLSESRQDVRLQRNLAVSAVDWERSGEDVSFLLRGTRLAQFEEWAEQTDLVLTEREKRYLQTSIAQRQRQQAAEAERQAREAELEQQARNRLRNLVVVLGVAFVVALVLSVFAFTQSQEAQSERDNAQTQVAIAATAESDARREAQVSRSLALDASARQLQTIGDYELALALALEANNIESPPDQAQRTLANIAYAPGMIRQWRGHVAAISSVAISPRQAGVLSGSSDGSLALWNTDTGELIREFRGHQLPVASVAFSPSGEQIVSGSWDTTLILWDVASGEQIQRFEGHRGAVNTLVISADGQRVVSGSTDGIIVWDLQTGELLRQFGSQMGIILSLAISQDGSTILAGSQDNQLIAWDAQTGEERNRFEGHTADILSVAISPDDETAVSSSRDGSIILWNLDNGRMIRRFGIEDEANPGLQVNSVAYSLDGSYILTGSEDRSVILWDIQTGRMVRVFEGHASPVASVDYDPEQLLAVSGSEDGVLILWSLAYDAALRIFPGHANSANSVDLNSDGTLAVTGSDDNTLVIWDVSTGMALREITGHTNAVTGVAFSPDDTLIASGSDDRQVRVWDAITGDLLAQLVGHTDAVNDVVFGADNHTLISAGDDEIILVWDVRTGEPVMTLTEHERRVLSLDYNPQSETFISGSADRTAILWNANTGEVIHRLTGHERRVMDVALNSDGSLAVTGSDDNSVILWNLENGEMIRQFNISGESAGLAVFSVAFSPDDSQVMIGVEDGSVLLWDVTEGQVLRQYSAADLGSVSSVVSLAFSPDGESVISSLRNGRVILWRTPSLDGLKMWIRTNRFVPELTCEQRQQYGTEVTCETS